MYLYSLISITLLSSLSSGGCVSLELTPEVHHNGSYDDKLHLQRAHSFAERGLYREAIEAYKHILAQNPNHPLVNRNIGIVYVHLGLYKRGFVHLKKAYLRFAQNFQTNYYLAEAYRVKKLYSQAIKHYDIALSLRHDPRAMRGLAWSYYSTHNYQKALAALAREHQDTQTQIIRARIYLATGDYTKAQDITTNAKRREEKVFAPFLTSLLGDIYYNQGDLQTASRYYQEALFLRPHLPSALLGQGKILYKQGNHKKASALLSRSLRIKTDQAEAYFYLALIYTVPSPKKALFLYKRFISLAQKYNSLAYLVRDAHKNISELERTIAGIPQ